MKLRILFQLIAIFISLPAYSQNAGKPPQDAAIQHVIVVSVDGLMPEAYLNPEAHGLQVPALREMVRNAAYSRGVQPIFPTVTYPSHASIATGCNPATHGIVTNRAWDPLERNSGGLRWYAEDLKIQSIWELLRNHHRQVALIGWPVTVGAASDLLVPDFWRANTAEDLKLLRAVSTPGLLEAVEHEFPNFSARYLNPETRDEAMTDVAIHSISTQKPSLLMLHLIKVVYKEHVYGPFSPQAIAAIEDVDRQIVRIVQAVERAGIKENSVIMVLSDYGFMSTSTDVHPGVLLAKAGLVVLDERHRIKEWKATAMPMDGTTYIYVKDQNDDATRRAVLELFQPLVGKPGSGIARLITQEQISKMGGDPNAFLAMEAADGFSMEPGYEGDYSERADMAGTHGLFPDRAEMYGSLLVAGAPIDKGEIQGGRLIDIAPTLASWFGLRLGQAEGTVLPIKLKRHESQQAASRLAH
jgi:predicted AlkP superfamily pyrophosphatase or phosphodiesterase